MTRVEAALYFALGTAIALGAKNCWETDVNRPALIEIFKDEILSVPSSCPADGEVIVNMPNGQVRSLGSGYGGIAERADEVIFGTIHPQLISNGNGKYQISGVILGETTADPPVTFKSGKVDYSTASIKGPNGSTKIRITYKC